MANTDSMVGDSETDHALEESRLILERGGDLEAALSFMRSRGLSIIQCIKVVRKLLDVDLREAKDLVHFSQAFAVQRPAYDVFHRELDEALAELADGSQD